MIELKFKVFRKTQRCLDYFIVELKREGEDIGNIDLLELNKAQADALPFGKVITVTLEAKL